MMNKTKKKNVYVKYAVIMCISGALGGILGGIMEMGHVHGVLTGIQEGMQFFQLIFLYDPTVCHNKLLDFLQDQFSFFIDCI